MAKEFTKTLGAVGMVLACVSGAQGLEMDWVTVGDSGNAMDTRYPRGGIPGFGEVGYEYSIGKYEVTAGQYTEFLNAIAVADTYGLYNTNMWAASRGCKIERTGSPGSYGYSVAADRANRPVNYVSWYDALRFANWLHNGQLTGSQDASTTEDGAYALSLGSVVVRQAGALVVLPSEDEWYKAAYYKSGGTGAGYWDYPTQSNTAPTSEAPAGGDMVNGSANYYDFYTGSYAVGAPYYTNEVGAYDAKPSDSAYGTFDQGGNVSEWNEADIYFDGSRRGFRGGAFSSYYTNLPAWDVSNNAGPTEEGYNLGFRVAAVPEPATITLLALASVGTLVRRRT